MSKNIYLISSSSSNNNNNNNKHGHLYQFIFSSLKTSTKLVDISYGPTQWSLPMRGLFHEARDTILSKNSYELEAYKFVNV